jgi:hypothetical protein
MTETDKISPEEARLRSEIINRLNDEQRSLYYDVLSSEQVKAGKERKSQPTIGRKFDIIEEIITGEITPESVKKEQAEPSESETGEEQKEPAWRRATDPDDFTADEALKDPKRVEWAKKRLEEGKGLVVGPDEEDKND